MVRQLGFTDEIAGLEKGMTGRATMTEERYLKFVQSLRLTENPAGTADPAMKLRPLFGSGGIGSSLVYFNVWDSAAWKTWAEISFSNRTGGCGLLWNVGRAVIREFRPWARDRQPRGISLLRCPGTVVLLRNQKIIVVDRVGGEVFHVLRNEYDSERHLLECEAVANRILPEQTIQVLHVHPERSPRFLVQAYVRHEVLSWRDLLPHLGDMLAALFAYYARFGFREVDTNDHVDRLAAVCRERLSAGQSPEAGRVEKQLTEIICQIRARAAALAPSRTVLTRVHGDFISAHLVMRPDGFVITDWAESHEYSVFHDLFYFHFQNYGSDFVGRVLNFQSEQMPEYFGSGAERFAREFRERWNRKLTAEYLQLNFLVCFVQELEHRLVRLRGRVVDFWSQQAARMLAARS